MLFSFVIALASARRGGFKGRHLSATAETGVAGSDVFRTECPGAVKQLWPLPKEVAFSSCDGVPIAGARISAPDVLSKAVESFRQRISDTGSSLIEQDGFHVDSAGTVDIAPANRILELAIELGGSSLAQNATFTWSAALGPSVDESYQLSVAAPKAVLRAETPVGALRGLETLAQLAGAPGGVPAGVEVKDEPRYPHRGVLLDSSRHFLPVATLTSFLDAMAMNKLNVMHWHLTDSQGYSLGDKVSKKYGLDKGALFSGATYSEDDLRKVVEHASLLGIRVVPEIDGPAHVQSWHVGEPDAVVDCGYHSVLLPTGEPLVPKMLDELLGHLATIFPDKNVHLGADEVSQEAFQCMRKNPTVMKWVYEHHKGLDDNVRVHGEGRTSFLQQEGRWLVQEHVQASAQDLKDAVASYIGMVAQIAKKNGKQPVFWQEAFDDYGHNSYFSFSPPDQLPRDALIQVWKGWSGTAKMPDVVGQGFNALKSNDWYLDNGEDDDWKTMYGKDPAQYVHSGEEHIHGGEACLWGEHIDSSNLFTRAYPRLSAVAERLWSQRDVTNVHSANSRLQSMRCRLTALGYTITDLRDHACD